MNNTKFILQYFAILLIPFITFSCGSANKSSNFTVENTVLLEQDFVGEYAIVDKKFGTKTFMTIDGDKRVLQSNGLPNHSTGAFPNEGNPNTISAQKVNHSFPMKPVFTGKAKWAREPGVALNGVKFEPETAERFECESGEVYRVEAFQELIDLRLDNNHAHVQPTGTYHYYGVLTGLVKALDKGEDIILVGYAHDGYPIYYSKSGKYKPSFQLSDESRTGDACSYRRPHISIDKELEATKPDGTFVSDWNFVKGLGDLDECNGIEMNGKYSYFVTDSYPYMSRCLKGEFTQNGPKGPPPGAHPGGHHPHKH